MPAPVVRRSPVHRGTVVAAGPTTPRMRRVTVRADSMVGVEIRPAQDVELLLRDHTGRRVKRRYTIRSASPETGVLVLDVLLHGDGPGAQWGETAAPGDDVEFQGPRGKLQLRPATEHLLIGDESAIPAFACVAEALPAHEHASAVIEVTDTTDEQPIAADVQWLHRGTAPPGTPDLLAAHLEDRTLHTGARAYLLGESRAMVTLRALLERRGIAHDAIFLKGYWNVGRPDRLAGRPPR